MTHSGVMMADISPQMTLLFWLYGHTLIPQSRDARKALDELVKVNKHIARQPTEGLLFHAKAVSK